MSILDKKNIVITSQTLYFRVRQVHHEPIREYKVKGLRRELQRSHVSAHEGDVAVLGAVDDLILLDECWHELHSRHPGRGLGQLAGEAAHSSPQLEDLDRKMRLKSIDTLGVIISTNALASIHGQQLKHLGQLGSVQRLRIGVEHHCFDRG